MQRKKITALLLATAIVSQQSGVTVLANELTQNSNVKNERVIGVEEITNITVSDIDPETNPAEDNWLSREISKNVFNDENLFESLTQEDFNSVHQINGEFIKPGDTIPVQIGNLSNVEIIWLDNKGLTGTIPDSLYLLKSLRRLNLINNELNGTLSNLVSNLQHLETLYLANNKLVGNIPSSLWTMTWIGEIILSNNKFTGEIPSQIGNLTNLYNLGLAYCNLEGVIPAVLWNLDKLQQLYLDGNNFYGNLPNEIGNLVNLRSFGIAHNNMSGTLPESLYTLENLEKIMITGNQFYGTISDSISNLTKLRWAHIAVNQFIGDVPEYLKTIESPVYDRNLFDNEPNQQVMVEEDRVELRVKRGEIITDDILRSKYVIIPSGQICEQYDISLISSDESYFDNSGIDILPIKNGKVDVQIKISYGDYSYTSPEVFKLSIVDEVLSYDEFWNELKEVIPTNNETIEDKKAKIEETYKILSKYEQLVPEISYLYNQNDDRKEKFISGFRNQISFFINKENRDSEITTIVDAAILFSEISKFIGYEQSNTNELSIPVNYGDEPIDITDYIYQLEEGETLLEGLQVGKIEQLNYVNIGENEQIETDLFILTSEGRLLLKPCSNIISSINNISFKTQKNYTTVHTYIKFKIIDEEKVNKVKVEYQKIKELISSENYSKEALLNILQNELSFLPEINYLESFDNIEMDLFLNELVQIIKYPMNGSETDIQEAITRGLIQAESSKINSVRAGGLKIEVEDTTQQIEITDQLLKLVEGKELLNGTSVDLYGIGEWGYGDKPYLELIPNEYFEIIKEVVDGKEQTRVFLKPIGEQGKIFTTAIVHVGRTIPGTTHTYNYGKNVYIQVVDKSYVDEYDVLYNELKALIDSENYTKETLAAELNKYEETKETAAYLASLDEIRTAEFIKRFKSILNIYENYGGESKDVIRWSIGHATVMAEAKKYLGKNELITINVTDDTKEIDITDQVMQLQGNNTLLADTNVNIVGVGEASYGEQYPTVTPHEAFEIRTNEKGEQRIILKSITGKDNINTNVFIEVSRNNPNTAGSTFTNIMLSVVNKTAQAKYEAIYNELKALIEGSSYTNDKLIKLLESHSNVLNLNNYTVDLDTKRKEVFANRFKEMLKNDSYIQNDYKGGLENCINFARTITESSKLKYHFESGNKILEISTTKNAGVIDITEKIFALDGNQALDKNTIIANLGTNNEAIIIVDDRIMLDTSKLEKITNTSIDFMITNNNSSSRTNICFKVLLETSEDEIKDQLENLGAEEENPVINVIPAVNEESEKEITLNKEIIEAIINKNANVEINDGSQNLLLNSTVLNELQELLKDSGATEPLTLTINEVNNDVVEELQQSGVNPIGTIKLGANTGSNSGITLTNGKITVTVRLNNGQTFNMVRQSRLSASKPVYVYSVINGKTNLIAEATMDANGDVKFETSYLGDIIITDKKIGEETTTPPTPPTPPSYVDKAPAINAKDVVVNVGQQFNPLTDVTSNDTEDGDITKNIKVIENTVDTSKAGVYKVVYEVRDSYGNKVTKEIKVTVNEVLGSAPVIYANNVTLKVGEVFNPLLGVSAFDKEDGDLTKLVKVLQNNVNENKEGTYKVAYEVIDSQGKKTIKEIVVTIKGSLNVDELYKNSYRATFKALTLKTQATINEARVAIKKLPKTLAWAIGEFSKQLDSIQHPKLVAIVKSINAAKANPTQANVNAARKTVEEELPTMWKNSYSVAIDKVQQQLINTMIEAVKVAETNKTEETIQKAQNIINDISTSNSINIKELAKKMQERLDLVIKN